MRRTYTAEEYRTLVAKLRDRVPNIALSTDIIVGFCGETDQEFEQTYQMMADIRYDSAFMFKYSEREGTLAHKALPDDVPETVKGQRLKQIIELQEQISADINTAAVGETGGQNRFRTGPTLAPEKAAGNLADSIQALFKLYSQRQKVNALSGLFRHHRGRQQDGFAARDGHGAVGLLRQPAGFEGNGMSANFAFNGKGIHQRVGNIGRGHSRNIFYLSLPVRDSGRPRDSVFRQGKLMYSSGQGPAFARWRL